MIRIAKEEETLARRHHKSISTKRNIRQSNAHPNTSIEGALLTLLLSKSLSKKTAVAPK
jgi:hypothetical protein